jgi:hypothetical protein
VGRVNSNQNTTKNGTKMGTGPNEHTAQGKSECARMEDANRKKIDGSRDKVQNIRDFDVA